jgi:adenylyltransferase/sulfurtransferase
MRRYGRHLVLPGVGVEGQRRLKRSKVLLVGVGGLGSPAALYLAAAGVGTLGLVDSDAVEASNLHRQILFGDHDVGRPKLAVAEKRLRSLNRSVRVRRHDGVLDRENALRTIRPYDVVVDGTDNYPARYLVNDACVLLGKPDVFAAVYRFEAQASVFDARRGPCYRCLFPEPPPADALLSCDAAGVLGPLPGIVGVIQATETLKLLLGIGEPLIGRLLLFDALSMGFREFGFRRSPHCPRCSRSRRHGLLSDIPDPAAPADVGESVPTLTVEELAKELARRPTPWLVDIRAPAEFAINHLPGAHRVPEAELPERLGKLAVDRPVVVYCKSGPRSMAAVGRLRARGFRNLRHLAGGIDAWVERVDPTMAR